MSRVFLGIALGMSLMFVIAAFEQSLPLWCATPEVGINYFVQPLCK